VKPNHITDWERYVNINRNIFRNRWKVLREGQQQL